MTSPIVAIVGRPNVGKSTLFNRLAGRRQAIVTDIPGTTRDRILADVSWDGSHFTVIDTGGLEPRPQGPLGEKVKAQVEAAISEADLIIFLLDVGDGLMPMDREIANSLRRTEKPLVVAVNKVDNLKLEVSAAEFFQLGLDQPFLISAYHNLGVYDLMERVVSLLPPAEGDPEGLPEGTMKLAIVGRTNVGKSTLLNAILGQERAIVSEVPGTTRDAQDTAVTYGDQPVVLIDTAGIRRPGKVEKGIEAFSVIRAVRAVKRCDIALLVMDATELATAQDAHISGHAWDAYKGLIAVVNKWDLLDEEDRTSRELAIQTVRQRLHFMPYVPICFTSALRGDGISDLMALATDINRERLQRIPPGKLHYALVDALGAMTPPSRGGRSLTINGLRQVDVNPPTFLFSVNHPERIHFSYQRFLENRLRSTFGFTHTHLKLAFRRKI